MGKLSTRTKNLRVHKAKDAVVASLEVISPEDPGSLWEALKDSQSIENTLSTTQKLPGDKKYLSALAETYQNAVSWDTRRQVLSIMADLVPSSAVAKPARQFGHAMQIFPCSYTVKTINL